MIQQVLRNSGAKLSQTFYADEVPTSADGAVQVVVTKADGSADSSGAATLASPGQYTYVLAPHANLDTLTVTWSGTFSGVAQTLTSYVEIVGGYYVSLSEIRAQPAMSDTGKYPTAALVAARRWFEERFENHVGMAWVPRGATQRLDGLGGYSLSLRHWPVLKVVSVKTYTDATTFTALTSTELADITLSDDGTLSRSLSHWTKGTQNIVVVYEHGHLSTPADVHDAALVAIRSKLMEDVSGARDNRQFAIATADGIVRSSTPGADRPFGIPAVDAVAQDYRSRYWLPAVA